MKKSRLSYFVIEVAGKRAHRKKKAAFHPTELIRPFCFHPYRLNNAQTNAIFFKTIFFIAFCICKKFAQSPTRENFIYSIDTNR